MTAGRGGRWPRRALVPALLLMPAGCVGLLAGPAPQLYRVAAVAAFPPGLPHVGAQVLVALPQAPEGLDTRRIALSRSPLSLDYFADAEWTDRLSGLVQTALVESFENSRAIPAVGRDTAGLRADFVLRSQIRHFEAEYGAGNGPPTIVAAMLVKLVRVPAGAIVATAAFTARQPAAANTMPAIIAAFNAALGRVVRSIVVWTLTRPALAARG